MAKKTINLGTPPLALDGDTLRAALEKINSNFDELYAPGGAAASAILAAANEWTGRQTFKSTDTGTSGTAAGNLVEVAVSPIAQSSRASFGQRVELTFNSSMPIISGGWLTASEKVVNTAGTGEIDKLVIDMAQANLTGGRVKSVVGYEAVISAVGANTIVEGFAGFYFPNVEALPNLANIRTMAAFQNDNEEARITSRGPYTNGDLVELPPPYHAGLIPDRYYSAPAGFISEQDAAPGRVYVTYVHVPHRVRIKKLGVNVTRGSAGKCRLAMYKVAAGKLMSKVIAGGELDTDAIGAKEAAVDVRLNSGTYALVATFSGTPGISWHEVQSHSAIGGRSPLGFKEIAFIAPFPYGELPQAPELLPSFDASTIEPHLWFRV